MSEHELWNELGNLYFLSGEYGQAVHAYRRAIQLDGSFGRPYSNLALTYVQQGKYDLAIDLYRRSIELLSENKEKAISWNRLGNVLRHLKDYKQAVVAYRNADELDPESEEGGDKPGWLTEHAVGSGKPQGAGGDAALTIDDPFPYAASKVVPEATSEAEDDPTATWAPMDPTLFQQDTFEALDPGTLTTWGDQGLEAEDPDFNWPPDVGTEVYIPEADSDDMTKWIPIPEEQPVDSLEYSLEAVDLAAEIEEPSEALQEVEGPANSGGLAQEPRDGMGQPIETTELTEMAGPAPTMIETRTPTEAIERSSVTTTDLDVIVEERPAREYMVAAEGIEAGAAEPEAEPSAEAAAEATLAQGEAQAAASELAEAESATSPEPEPASVEPQRDPDELREIEAGLAKYKRVVQLNPKNARAWDTLGNLYKSAGQYKEALLAYQRAIENDSSKALFHHHLGLVYACEGRIDEAIEAFQRVVEIDPVHALANATLGGYYRRKGLEELAQKHIGIAMKSIFDSENEYNRACLAAICGNTDQALELLRVALMNKQTYVDWILRDPDLDHIRQDPRFKQLVSDYAR